MIRSRQKTISILVLGGLAGLFASGLAGSEALSPQQSAEALNQLIKRHAKAARGLRIDGRVQDWRELTVVPDQTPERDASIDAGRDIIAVGCLPTPEALAIVFQTRGDAASGDGVFRLAVDAGGRYGWEFGVSLRWSKPSTLDLKYADGRSTGHELPELEAVRKGPFVECRLPWPKILALVEPKFRDSHELTAPALHKGWVRVRVSTREDRGLTAASYIIDADGGPRLRQLPASELPPVQVAWPMTGLAFLSQGSFTSDSHAGDWAWDIIRVDQALRRAVPVDEADAGLKDFFAYGAVFHSCTTGTVIGLVDKEPDRPLGKPGGEANLILVRGADGIIAFYGHNRPASALVTQGQQVQVGTPLAQIGNTGQTSNPHLHLHFRNKAGTHLPARFRDVIVSLNPHPEDPWRQHLQEWEPREGFFVQPGRAFDDKNGKL